MVGWKYSKVGEIKLLKNKWMVGEINKKIKVIKENKKKKKLNLVVLKRDRS